MIEPEIAFADLKDNMTLAKDMMQFIIRRVLERCPDEMEFFNKFEMCIRDRCPPSRQ